ncbi:MAG: tRNA (adenosine(37)-N6)-threonylcarbamoyltransferase complex transferase subunit TsaD [Rhabdochlamydiaceae bacterium]
MLILGIETTCDETACSVVEDGKKILSNVIYSQVDIHALYGGVFPELCSRKHQEVLLSIVDQALKEAHVTSSDLQAIAVAKGPGLIGALVIGVNAAKTLSFCWDIPFIGVNHVEAHLYAAIMNDPSPLFPSLGLVISGGHTFLVLIKQVGEYEMIGSTQDDAIGEVFDKVGVMLGFSYPAGPSVEKLALTGNPRRFPFKKGVVKGRPWDFSFSGLKTNVLYTLKGANSQKEASLIIPKDDLADVAASFQQVALQDIVQKSTKAFGDYRCHKIYVGGGVSRNNKLKELFRDFSSNIPVIYPSDDLCLDNGAMIAGLGYHIFKEKQISDPFSLEPVTRIPL